MKLIHTSRHWLPRLVDTLLTLIAWLVFFWLLARGIAEVLANQRQGPRVDMGTQMLSGLDSLLLYLVLSLLVGAIIILWANYRQRQAGRFERRKRVPDMSEETLSTSFGVDPRLLRLLQEQQVLTVHNDAQGHLLSVEMPALNKHYAARKSQKVRILAEAARP